MLGHLGDLSLCWIIFGHILCNLCGHGPITPKKPIPHVRAARITDTTLEKPTVFAFRDRSGHAAERGVPEPRGMATTEGDWWILVERKDDMLT